MRSRAELTPETCALHADRPAECPREHVCECGARLNEHRGTGATCPNGRGSFRPDARTLARFPEQYYAAPP